MANERRVEIDWEKSPFYRTRKVPVINWKVIHGGNKCPASIFSGLNAIKSSKEREASKIDSCES